MSSRWFAFAFVLCAACGSSSEPASTATSAEVTDPNVPGSYKPCTYHEYGTYANDGYGRNWPHDTNNDCPPDPFRYSCEKIDDSDMREFQPGYCHDSESDRQGCLNLRCGCGTDAYRDKLGICRSFEARDADLPPSCVSAGRCTDLRPCVQDGTCYPEPSDIH